MNQDLPDKASSFSDWLKQKAESEGIQVSTFWRYLNAASYAIDNPIGPWQAVTQAEQIPADISAEVLELAEKNRSCRAAEGHDRTVADVYHKKLHRMDLLKIWQNYRDALPSDTTARGRGAKRPVVNKGRPEHQAEVLKVDALNRLQQMAPECLGYPAAAQLRVVKPESV